MELQRFFAQALRQPSAQPTGQDFEGVVPAEKLGPVPQHVRASMGPLAELGRTPMPDGHDPSMELHFDPSTGQYVQQQAAGLVRIPVHDAQRMMEKQEYLMASDWPGAPMARR